MCCVFSGLFSWWSSLFAWLVLMPSHPHIHLECLCTHTNAHWVTARICDAARVVARWFGSPYFVPKSCTTHTLYTICFSVTKLKIDFRRPEMRVMCCSVCVCVSIRDNTIFSLPQAVCSRRSWRFILPALSGVFRPPHQQVKEKRFHLARINCCLLFCFLPAVPFLVKHFCAFKVIYSQIKRDS